MSDQHSPQIILIDDDPANNMISKLFIKKVVPEASVISYTDPVLGVNYLQNEFSKDPFPTILMLDINMPVLSGWDVLDKISLLPPAVKDHMTIYIVSSSINPLDKKKADESTLVKAYIEKPFNISLLENILISALTIK
jgi:CheY-like chemotaxis protein